MYAVFRRLAPYRPILVFLLVSFIISTLVLLWVGPYRFLIGSVPRNTRHHEAKTIQWSYLLTIGSYLVASGAFVEFLCGQEGGDRIIALDSKDNAQAFMSVRIWLTQLALSFITIGILEPIRQKVSYSCGAYLPHTSPLLSSADQSFVRAKRADIQPCFTELFPRLPCFQVQARWILFSLYSASFAMFTLFLLVVLVDAVLEKIYGPNVRMSIIFDICSSRVDRPLIVPALAFSLMDLAETARIPWSSAHCVFHLLTAWLDCRSFTSLTQDGSQAYCHPIMT